MISDILYCHLSRQQVEELASHHEVAAHLTELNDDEGNSRLLYKPIGSKGS